MTHQQRLAPGEFRADAVAVDGSTNVMVRGELDLHTGAQLWETCRQEVDRLPAGGELVVDLSALEFIDAAGLGVLVRLRNHLALAGKRLRVDVACPSIRRVFEIADLVTLLQAPQARAKDRSGTGGSSRSSASATP